MQTGDQAAEMIRPLCTRYACLRHPMHTFPGAIKTPDAVGVRGLLGFTCITEDPGVCPMGGSRTYWFNIIGRIVTLSWRGMRGRGKPGLWVLSQKGFELPYGIKVYLKKGVMKKIEKGLFHERCTAHGIKKSSILDLGLSGWHMRWSGTSWENVDEEETPAQIQEWLDEYEVEHALAEIEEIFVPGVMHA